MSNILMSLLIKCEALKRDGVGTLHMHRYRWASGRTKRWQAWFVPEGTSTAHFVPEDKLSDLSNCSTTLEAMALLRKESR